MDVRGRLVLTNGSRVRSITDAEGEAAPIQVVARDVEISGGSKIESSTGGKGKAGNVTVDASRSIVISNPDPIFGSFAQKGINPQLKKSNRFNPSFGTTATGWVGATL